MRAGDTEPVSLLSVAALYRFPIPLSVFTTWELEVKKLGVSLALNFHVAMMISNAKICLETAGRKFDKSSTSQSVVGHLTGSLCFRARATYELVCEVHDASCDPKLAHKYCFWRSAVVGASRGYHQ